ncbi:conjugal transfer protein TraO [Cytophagaceae bacterium DM2B3-1]|uniref:Conjugal transfer protein TraO n=1 Tax=Xanthocytophaga flava TaxID=3048013 RepID=A0ABT7CVB4_9BACT|nr:conjugal transfer protein TraO [Xanthocytophaga flavus]MDJ1497606.1 conjugal transfer protein TraO [Xanthocytophaga flavus]
MKKLINVITTSITCIGIGCLAHGQVHIKGQKGLEIQAGIVDHIDPTRKSPIDGSFNSYFISLGINKYLSTKATLKYSFTFDKRFARIDSLSNDTLNYTYFSNRYIIEALYQHFLIKNTRGNLYFNLGAGPLIGYEQFTSSMAEGDTTWQKAKSRLEDKSTFLLGLSASAEIEWFFSHHSALMLQYRHRWLVNSEADKFHYYLGAGVKLLINK